jgi:hypothetical protein
VSSAEQGAGLHAAVGNGRAEILLLVLRRQLTLQPAQTAH